MPPHIKKNEDSSELKIWNTLLLKFARQNYLIIPSEKGVPKHSPEKYLYFLPNINGISKVVDPMKAISEVLTLKNIIQEISKQYNFKMNLFWNYCGKNKERDEYLSYLEKIIWQNQHIFPDFEIFQELTKDSTNKVHIIKDYFHLNVKIFSDFFSEESMEFYAKISVLFHDFYLDPFLFLHADSNIHFTMELQYLLELRGFIIKKNQWFYVDFVINPLTGIIF